MKVNQSIEWIRVIHGVVCAFAAGLLLQAPCVNAQEKPDRVPKNEEEVWSVRPLRLTVQVVGEDGKPVEEADVRIDVANEVYYRDEYNTYKGGSGPDGKFSVESEGCGAVRISVTKNGYYGSGIPWYMFIRDYSSHGEPADAEDLRTKKGKPWQPWDPTVRIMIKRMIKPIPMLARHIEIDEETPAEALTVDKDMEWDMFEGQWLPPYGKGKVADLIVRFSKVASATKFTASMNVRFPNKNDGLIPINDLIGRESRLKFPREAPEDGYDLKSYSASILDDNDNINPIRKDEPSIFPKAYYIRLRTKLDEKGKVVSTYYGKITTNLELVPPAPPIRLRRVYDGKTDSFKIAMDMNYYLNPTPNDPNLEFDCKTNKAGNETYNRSFQP